MGKHFALLGAGFSRNWGGWLAAEAFEYLIGLPSLQKLPEIIRLLWRHREHRGFEAALEALQNEYARSKTAENKHQLVELEKAIIEMFADMDSGYFRQGLKINDHTKNFLAMFDAIFTLNQDVLLERHYMIGSFPPGGGPRQWRGAYLPGVDYPFAKAEYELARWQRERWRIPPQTPTSLREGDQPIVKLHGSSLWRRDGRDGALLVLGGHKSGTIADDPLLKWYGELFEQALLEPAARLMTIGYGFRDNHINDAIKLGLANGLKVFNISPQGTDAWVEIPNGGPTTVGGKGKNYLEDALIGASRLPLPEGTAEGSAEYRKLMRFFD